MYLDSIPLIEEIVAFVCRKSRFAPADCEDFLQEVHLKLIEDDYRVLRECSGANLRSYLKVVISRASLDRRNHMWGKYRDGTEAKRLGRAALLLERLLERDRLNYEEARQYLRINEKIELTDEEFDVIRVKLPPKLHRQFVAVDPLYDVAASAPTPEEALQAKAAAQKQAGILTMVAKRVSELSSERQLLLKLLFEEGLKVSEIARARRVAQKPLYAERDRALRWLRERLEEDGISKEELQEIFRQLLGPAGLDGPDEG